MDLFEKFSKESIAVAVAAQDKFNQKLIKNTAFEELLKNIDEEDIQPRNIFLEIITVYYFMRNRMNMRPRLITISEFEIVSQNNKPNYRIDPLGRLEIIGTTAFDSPFGTNTWSNFDPFGNYPFGNFKILNYMPSNIRDLTREIYQKRFGRPIPRPDITTASKIEPSLTPQSGDTAAE